MGVSRKGKYRYGTSDSDVEAELVRYSEMNGYLAVRFARATCACGSDSFALETDEEVGAARRTCSTCRKVTLMGDSAEYAAEAAFESHVCICDHSLFGITSGVALYAESNDVRWYYIGCRCRSCQLIGVFADWKSESGDADAFLAET